MNVKALVDLIRGVDHLSDLRRIGEERHDFVPGAPPGRADRRVLLAPFGLELGKPLLGHVGGLGAIDRAQRRRQPLAVLPRHEVQAVADQMDDAGLHDGAREDGGDGVGEALQPIDHGEQEVLDAAVLEFVHDPQPELGALGLLDPQAQDMLVTLAIESQGQVDGLVPDHALVADLDSQCIEEDHRIDRIERPVLPLAHLVQHGIGDPADQVGRDVDGIELAQVTLGSLQWQRNRKAADWQRRS